MNFSSTKQDSHTKKCLVRAFVVNSSNTNVLYNQIAQSNRFLVDTVIKITSEKHLKLKEYDSNGIYHYFHFALYNPKAQVSITPLIKASGDLLDVENLDDLHAFILVKDNKIAALMQISTNWCEIKLAKIFEQFGLKIQPKAILQKNVVQRIKDDKMRALHLNIDVDESDFVKAPGLIESIFTKEPKVRAKGISGHLTIDSKSNVELAQSIESNPSAWVSDLDADFYIETKKGEKITSDDLKLTKIYFTVPYGSKSINAKYAKEILEDFAAKEL